MPFSDVVTLYFHFTVSTKNLPRGQFKKDVHFMLCRYTVIQWACLLKRCCLHNLPECH